MLSELASPHIRCCLSAIPSDLIKSTAVDESLSSVNQQFCSRENQLLQTEENMPYGNSNIPKELGKVSKTPARNMEYRYISREEKQSKTY